MRCGSGISLMGPHAKLGGPYADIHACQVDEHGGGEEWPLLPGPVRVSYTDAEGFHLPALYIGSSKRMRQSGTARKKQRTRA